MGEGMATYELDSVTIKPNRNEVTLGLRVTSGRRDGQLDSVRITEAELIAQAGVQTWNALRELARTAAETALRVEEPSATVTLVTPVDP